MIKKTNTIQRSRPKRRQTSAWESLQLFYASRRSIILALLLILPILAWVMGWHMLMWEGLSTRTASLFESSGFVVKEVLVEGRQQTDSKLILAAVGTKRGDSIFACDPELAKQQLETIHWIRSAMVQRIMPDRVFIRLVERNPIAIWQNASKRFLVDEDGVVIENFDPKVFRHLMVITGQDAPQHAKPFFATLSDFSELRQRIKSAVFISGRRWDLILENKVRVKLPEKDIRTALMHLEKLEKEHQLTDGRVATIDLRLPDRSFLRVQDTDEEKKNKGKIT